MPLDRAAGRSATRTCGTTSSGSSEVAAQDRSQARRRSRFWTSWKRTIRRPTSCWRPSAMCWAACGLHHRSTTSSRFLRRCCPFVEETPPFERALTFASMDTPGPYEKVAKEAFFNVTLPEPTGRSNRSKSTWKASTAAPSSAPRFTKLIPGTTCSSCGCSRCRRRCASCWAPIRTPKAGRTTASR